VEELRMSFDLLRAKDFVQTVDISGTPRGIVEMDAEGASQRVFNSTKDQALAVGSGLFAFEKGVDSEVREAISASALLAQLVANKRASKPDQSLDWFNEYSQVLQNVGWTLQSREWNDYSAKGTALEVNEQIITVMTVALGPSAAALAILESTVRALRAMEPDSSWFTIFNRDAQKASIARFHVGLVEIGPENDVFVSLIGCLVEAESEITQVLFFKFRNAHARFRANSHKVSIDRESLKELKGPIRAKIAAYQNDYVSSITDLELGA
jgi:hypothetical protein